MKLNRFYINIVVRILAIVISALLFVYFFHRNDNILTTAFIAFMVVIETILLINYVNRTNRDLAEFLIHLQQGDTSVLFNKKGVEKTFKDLNSSFEKISTDLSEVKTKNTQQEHYLKFVIDNLKTGLIAFDINVDIEFYNIRAKVFLNKENSHLKNIDELEDVYLSILKDTNPSESKIIKRVIDDNLYYLAFTSSQFKIDKKTISLFSIHDVKQEIESNEIESWQKLTSVLTHEMMNSLTPITSLAHAIKSYIIRDDKLVDKSNVNEELLTDVIENADLIENRSKGLLEFINNYRSIAKLPKPKFNDVNIYELWQNIIQLFDKEIQLKQVAIHTDIHKETKVFADKAMIEQVLINLFKNALEALKEVSEPVISVNSFIDENQQLKLIIQDNGRGIKEENLGDVFVPFYTTKENGTGVGLSLSRQIMRLHNGTISINSKLNEFTKVILAF